MLDLWEFLVYLTRRWRGRCFGCGRRPPRYREAVYCAQCHAANVARARQIIGDLKERHRR